MILLEVLEGQPTREAELEAERRAGGYLEQVVGALRSRGLRRARTCVWYGDAHQAIANAATRERADLIAMSTHGRSGLDRLRFGSVAEGVVRRAPVPVLLVRGMAAWDRGGIDRGYAPSYGYGGYPSAGYGGSGYGGYGYGGYDYGRPGYNPGGLGGPRSGLGVRPGVGFGGFGLRR